MLEQCRHPTLRTAGLSITGGGFGILRVADFLHKTQLSPLHHQVETRPPDLRNTLGSEGHAAPFGGLRPSLDWEMAVTEHASDHPTVVQMAPEDQELGFAKTLT